MNAKLTSLVQTITQRTSDETTAVLEALEHRLKDVHTALPGHVLSFDPEKQTAAVLPGIQRIWYDKGAVDLPSCVDVPVQFFGAGGYGVTVPVAHGDECLLVFSERAIDLWWQNGCSGDHGQLPAEYRLHDLSDGFAILGFRSLPNKLQAVVMDAVEILCPSGKYINLGHNATHPLPLFDTFMQDLEADLTRAVSACGVMAAACNGPTAALGPGVSMLKQALQDLLNKATQKNHYFSDVSRTV